MNYFIKRGEQEYGPYSLVDLQTYVQQGSISRDDLVRSEGLDGFLKVSQVIGNIAATPAPAFGAIQGSEIRVENSPPKLHWGVVLVLTLVTFGIFGAIWLFVLAVWARKVQPETKALYYLIGYACCAFGSPFFGESVSPVLRLAAVVFFVVAEFALKGDVEDTFNRSLSGVMTFFFGPTYLQYHLNEIRQMQSAAATA